MPRTRTASVTLRRAIADSGLTLVRLAELSGVDAGRLSRFVRRQRGLTLDAVDKLCRVFRLELVRKGQAGGPQKRRKQVKR